MRIDYKNTVYRDLLPVQKKSHNEYMRNYAEKFAKKLIKNPSWLEKQMMEFLKNHGIKYEFQKIFYIKDKAGVIKQFFIVDFYFPYKRVALEVDGAYHKNQVDYDEYRTRKIQKHYPKVTIVRWETKDFRSYNNMKKLLELIK